METVTCTYAIINNNILIYIRLLWQRCLSVSSIVHVQILDIWFWAPVLLWPQLQTGQPELPLLVLYCLTQVFFLFFSCSWAPGSLLWLAQTLHTDCKSFTSCQEKAGLEGGGQASQTVPHQPRWGECRPFMRGLSRFAASEEFVAFNRDSCRSSRHSVSDLDCDFDI